MERAGQLTIRSWSAADIEASLEALAALLRDTVESGASIGFLLPLAASDIEAYWQGVLAELREGRQLLVAASEGDRLVGTVQLGLEPRANGDHRAEVMKLMVLRSHRRRGVGRALMSAALDLARRRARTLVLLDVRSGDPAERLYRELGFTRIGDVPAYARNPDGSFAPTSFYYLDLGAAPGGPTR